MKEEVLGLNDSVANISNQLESVRVEDIAWCRARITKLEKPNNPANRSLWQLVNRLVSRVEDQDNLIKGLQAGLVGAKDRVGVLEMSSLMIRLRVQVLEEAMEIDPPMSRIFLARTPPTRSTRMLMMEVPCWWTTQRMRGTRRMLFPIPSSSSCYPYRHSPSCLPSFGS
jgi:hypothetical protein